MSIEFYRPMQDEGDVWREESWSFHGGSHVEQYLPIDISSPCVYVDGKHVQAGYDCPHDQPEDLDPGWTVQS